MAMSTQTKTFVFIAMDNQDGHATTPTWTPQHINIIACIFPIKLCPSNNCKFRIWISCFGHMFVPRYSIVHFSCPTHQYYHVFNIWCSWLPTTNIAMPAHKKHNCLACWSGHPGCRRTQMMPQYNIHAMSMGNQDDQANALETMEC